MTTDFTATLRKAADLLDRDGWTQGVLVDTRGRHCVTGAVMDCEPRQGDQHIVTAVLRHLNHAEGWNDAEGRTGEEVVGYLRTAEITDADLAGIFGPQWLAVVALVRRVAVLTEVEVEQLRVASDDASDAARYAARDAARDAALDAALDAVMNADRYALWGVAEDAAREAAWDDARYAARHAAGDAVDAAQALVIRDLISPTGFTANHYRTFTAPLAGVIGPIHPDDARDGLYVDTKEKS